MLHLGRKNLTSLAENVGGLVMVVPPANSAPVRMPRAFGRFLSVDLPPLESIFSLDLCVCFVSVLTHPIVISDRTEAISFPLTMHPRFCSSWSTVYIS